jgi:small redox-active disulfide protein 2
MKKIEVLGSGCAKCNNLEQVAKKAADSLGTEYEFEKVTDINRIMGYGVMTTPALVVDGVVKVTGRVPSVDEVKKMIG